MQFLLLLVLNILKANNNKRFIDLVKNRLNITDQQFLRENCSSVSCLEPTRDLGEYTYYNASEIKPCMLFDLIRENSKPDAECNFLNYRNVYNNCNANSMCIQNALGSNYQKSCDSVIIFFETFIKTLNKNENEFNSCLGRNNASNNTDSNKFEDKNFLPNLDNSNNKNYLKKVVSRAEEPAIETITLQKHLPVTSFYTEPQKIKYVVVENPVTTITTIKQLPKIVIIKKSNGERDICRKTIYEKDIKAEHNTEVPSAGDKTITKSSLIEKENGDENLNLNCTTNCNVNLTAVASKQSKPENENKETVVTKYVTKNQEEMKDSVPKTKTLYVVNQNESKEEDTHKDIITKTFTVNSDTKSTCMADEDKNDVIRTTTINQIENVKIKPETINVDADKPTITIKTVFENRKPLSTVTNYLSPKESVPVVKEQHCNSLEFTPNKPSNSIVIPDTEIDRIIQKMSNVLQNSNKAKESNLQVDSDQAIQSRKQMLDVETDSNTRNSKEHKIENDLENRETSDKLNQDLLTNVVELLQQLLSEKKEKDKSLSETESKEEEIDYKEASAKENIKNNEKNKMSLIKARAQRKNNKIESKKFGKSKLKSNQNRKSNLIDDSLEKTNLLPANNILSSIGDFFGLSNIVNKTTEQKDSKKYKYNKNKQKIEDDDSVAILLDQKIKPNAPSENSIIVDYEGRNKEGEIQDKKRDKTDKNDNEEILLNHNMTSKLSMDSLENVLLLEMLNFINKDKRTENDILKILELIAAVKNKPDSDRQFSLLIPNNTLIKTSDSNSTKIESNSKTQARKNFTTPKTMIDINSSLLSTTKTLTGENTTTSRPSTLSETNSSIAIQPEKSSYENIINSEKFKNTDKEKISNVSEYSIIEKIKKLLNLNEKKYSEEEMYRLIGEIHEKDDEIRQLKIKEKNLQLEELNRQIELIKSQSEDAEKIPASLQGRDSKKVTEIENSKEDIEIQEKMAELNNLRNKEKIRRKKKETGNRKVDRVTENIETFKEKQIVMPQIIHTITVTKFKTYVSPINTTIFKTKTEPYIHSTTLTVSTTTRVPNVTTTVTKTSVISTTKTVSDEKIDLELPINCENDKCENVSNNVTTDDEKENDNIDIKDDENTETEEKNRMNENNNSENVPIIKNAEFKFKNTKNDKDIKIEIPLKEITEALSNSKHRKREGR